MRRIQLFELEDQPWMPRAIRDGVTDYLRVATRFSDPYGPVAPALSAALKLSKQCQVIDLCAGGGGPWQTLLPALRDAGWNGSVTLTDLFPNVGCVEQQASGVTYCQHSVDALDIPSELKGFRTLFTAFHHFSPDAAKAFLTDAAVKQVPIGLFEVTRRSPKYVAAMLLSPLVVMILTPFIRPFSWVRLLLTYCIPLIPLVITWDGIVSCLRSYSITELHDMTAESPDLYSWEVGELRGKGLLPLTYVFGLPRKC